MIFKLALAIVLATTFATTAAADAFGLALHANGGSDTTLYRGEPLLVQTLLILEQDEAATVALAGGQPWTRALSLTLLDGAGQAVPLEWATMGAAPASSLARADCPSITPPTPITGLPKLRASEATAACAMGRMAAPLIQAVLPAPPMRGRSSFSTRTSTTLARGLASSPPAWFAVRFRRSARAAG